MLQAFITGAVMGLVSTPHCAAMCGPLSAAACSRSKLRASPLRYQGGRMLSYAFAGAFSGHIGRVMRVMAPGNAAVIAFSSIAASACLYLAFRLARRPSQNTGLVQLGTGPRGRSAFSTLARLVPTDPSVLGMLSVLLPCGVLGIAMISAIATSSPQLGASLMLGFSITSGAALLAAGTLAQAFPKHASNVGRRVAALALVFAAITLLAKPATALVAMSRGETPVLHCH